MKGIQKRNIKMVRSIPLGWPGLSENAVAIFLAGYSLWSLTAWFGIVENTFSL